MACRFWVTSRAATTAVAPIASPAALASFDAVVMGSCLDPRTSLVDSLPRMSHPLSQVSPLPTRVRIGYGSGSVATGAFGTVPGLMLLPYLTDSLGIAALRRGPDRLRCPRPGTSCSTRSPAGSATAPSTRAARAGPGCCAAGLAAGRARSRCSSPAPTSARRCSRPAWVLVFFLACATAYAFFQVPYVAMPAEITASYDERTRLMTWRVAILALHDHARRRDRAGDPRRGRRPRRATA